MIVENPMYLLLLVAALPLVYQAYRAETFRGRFIAVSYVAILLALSLAAASPQIQQEASVVEDDRLVVLQDESSSMLVEDRSMEGLEDLTLETRTIAAGNSSALEQSMMAMLEENTTYLVDSDMQDDTDFQDLEEAFADAGSELNFVKRDMKQESSVTVEGPSTAVPSTENTYTVKLESTTGEYETPEVEVNGEEVDIQQESESEYSFQYSFPETGIQNLKASIPDNDEYTSNNEYFKAVNVIERPDVLVIGEQGPLDEEINEFFALEHRNDVPEDLSQYYSVILKEDIGQSEALQDYLYDGNGLVYTGDTEEQEMDVLPVEEHDYSQDVDNPKIIIGIDNSQGATPGDWPRCEPGESLEGSKELGTNLVASLASQRPESIVGAFAYNNSVWELGEPRPLSNEEHRNLLLGGDASGGIPSIPVCGSAYHVQALQASIQMIGDSPGNVILITSGNMPPDRGIFRFEASDTQDLDDITPGIYQNRVLQEASSINDNVSLHTVAVGDDPEREFLEELAEEGNGEFYDGPEEFYALENRFQGGGGSERRSIATVSLNHFITEDLGRLSSTVTDVEDSIAKPSANTLVETSNDRPFLTTWRYGLGRVAAFSADGPDLQSVMSEEPVLFSRTLNWAVGNPERKDDGSVAVESARMGEEVVLTASYDAEGFVQVSEDVYRATTQPEETGFHDYFGHEFDYNYRSELQHLGYREDVMERLAENTGGEVFKEDSLEELEGEVQSQEIEQVTTMSLTPYLLVLALILFLVQVGVRKSKGWM